MGPEFEIGQVVYLVTDPEQQPRMITGYMVREGKRRIWLVSGPEGEIERYGMELRADRDLVMATGGTVEV
jgi:hypothetical protein